MNPVLSPNAKAILMLTAPLISGRGNESEDLLKPGEYKRLARHLRELQYQPADLLQQDAPELLRACQPVVDAGRLQRLLGRGFLLSQVVERWHSRAIWVVSRADAEYPKRLKVRLKEDAPAVLYGCGDIELLDSGGLAVVGSRNVDDALTEYTMAIGRLSARAGHTLISGAAKGIDQAAMRGALEAGGRVSGVLADSLEKTAMNRENRNYLLEGQLTLISPYDPSVGFNVGHAMQRNKLIYALSDISLVVNSDLNQGGTWTGAVEQLEKLHFVPVYVRSTGDTGPGIPALRQKGAQDWPNPTDPDELTSMIHEAASQEPATSEYPAQPALTLIAKDAAVTDATAEPTPAFEPEVAAPAVPVQAQVSPTICAEPIAIAPRQSPQEEVKREEPGTIPNPAEAVFTTVREVLKQSLTVPTKEAEVAELLNVSMPQAKAWLQRLLEEGVVEKQKKPSGYVTKRNVLF